MTAESSEFMRHNQSACQQKARLIWTTFLRLISVYSTKHYMLMVYSLLIYTCNALNNSLKRGQYPFLSPRQRIYLLLSHSLPTAILVSIRWILAVYKRLRIAEASLLRISVNTQNILEFSCALCPSRNIRSLLNSWTQPHSASFRIIMALKHIWTKQMIQSR